MQPMEMKATAHQKWGSSIVSPGNVYEYEQVLHSMSVPAILGTVFVVVA